MLFASFNTFVSHQTHPYSSCDGLCTDQNDTAASVHLRDDIAVVCSKLSQTSQYPTSNAKQVVLSNATERSDLSITTARATQFALQTTHHTQNLKGKTFQLPRSCSGSQLEQITSTQDPSTTQKLRSNFSVAATEIWAATHSNTSNQPYTLSF